MFTLSISRLPQWWLGLFVLAYSIPAISCDLATDVPKAECEEVKALALATEYSGTIEAFDTATRICLLPGVICRNGHISGFKYELFFGGGNTRAATTSLPARLNNLTSLTYLELRGANITSAFPDLSQLPALETLKITDSAFNTVIHNSVTQLSNLKTVEITQTSIPASTFPAFSNPQLENLTLSGTNLSGSLDNLNLPTGLRTLILDNNALTGSTAQLNTWQNLVTLSLAGNQISSAVENVNLPNLRELDLSNNQLTQFGYNELPSLTTLDLGNNQISFLDTGSLSEQSPILTRLALNDNLLSGFVSGLTFSILDTLLLQNNQFTGIADTNDVTSLLEINLSGNQITDGVNILALNNIAPRLVSLDVSRNGMVTLHPDLSLINLASLNVENNALTSLPFLPQVAPVLCELDASHNQFDDDINVFAGIFGHAVLRKTLQAIDLSNNQFYGVMNELPFNIAEGYSIDLSFNQFTGAVPQIISAQDEIDNNPCPERSGSVLIDLSNNQFSSIDSNYLQNIDGLNPHAIGNVVGQNLVVNVENNQLCGEIGNFVDPSQLLNATQVRLANNYLYTQRLDLLDYFDNNILNWSQQNAVGQCNGMQRFSRNTFTTDDATNQFSLQVTFTPPAGVQQQTSNIYFVAQVMPQTCSMKNQSTGQDYELPQDCVARETPYWIIFDGNSWTPWQGEPLEAIAAARQQIQLTDEVITVFNNESLATLFEGMNVYKGIDGSSTSLTQDIRFTGSVVPTASTNILNLLDRSVTNASYLDYVSPDTVDISPLQIFAGYGSDFVDMVNQGQFQHIFSITKNEIEQFSELHKSYYRQ